MSAVKNIFSRMQQYSLLLAFFCISGAVYASPSQHEVVFDLAWDEFQPDGIDVRSITQDAPAGRHGHVVAQGDKLFFADGTPARFWGVGLTFSQSRPYKFPPDSDTSDRLVQRLSRLGINHVRLVGLDGSAREPFEAWRKRGSLDSDLMDRLGYFIAELRKAGIYYSFSIHNNAVILLNDLPDVAANSKPQSMLWRYKFIRLFNSDAVDRIVEWHEAFYSWKNPYTGLSFAEDPANIYVASVNEDSIFRVYFQSFEHLDLHYQSVLESLFDEYLNDKYGSWGAAVQSWSETGACETAARILTLRKKLLTPDQLAKTCAGHRRAIAGFLVEIDRRFYERIRAALRGVGYKGLFTGTNNWYGYGNLYANATAGDYIEMHGYFDHPRRIPRKGGGPRVEGYLGHSYIARTEVGRRSVESEHSFLFSKTFPAALEDKPVVVSEWGHSAWSPYSYEGMALLTAYAAFQGYPVLDAHTYFNHPNPDPRDMLTRRGFAVSANPVLVSLMPSFAAAFLRGDIASPQEAMRIDCAEDLGGFYDYVLERGLRRGDQVCGTDILAGYKQKIRTRLVGSKSPTTRVERGDSAGSFVASTGEIAWRFSSESERHFVVDSPRFKMVATPSSRQEIKADGIDARFESHGIITVLSLTDEPISSMGGVLVTAVQSFRNTGLVEERRGGYRWVMNPGNGPARMVIPKVGVGIRIDDVVVEEIGICAHSPDGSTFQVRDFYLEEESDGRKVLRFTAGDGHGPWYLVAPIDRMECGD